MTVVESDSEVDFIVVRSEEPLVGTAPVIGLPRKMERYVLLVSLVFIYSPNVFLLKGYPNSESGYHALEGVFSTTERDDKGRMRGSSGSIRGYNGGPIFNYKGELLGINVANESPAKFVGFNGSNTVNDIINEINVTFPSLSIIVPTYYLAAKYHSDCKFNTSRKHRMLN